MSKVGRRGERTRVGERNVRKVERQVLGVYLDKFTSSIGHPPVETFPGIPDPEFAVIQVVVELIPEFLQNLYPCLCLVTFDLHPFELVLAVHFR